MNTIVNIPNTYVWIAPEKKSKYACRNAGIPIFVNHGINAYHRPSIIVPAVTLPNKRSDMETGVANSLIMLIGRKTGNGSNKSFMIPNHFVFIQAYSIITNVISARPNVVTKSAVGGRNPKSPEILDKKINAISAST